MMKILISRKMQLLSFLPVTLSLNDSSFKPLRIESITEFDTDTPQARFTMKLWGMKKEIVLDLAPTPSINLEMYFNLDKNQSLLVFLGFVASFFLMVSGLLNHKMLNQFVAASTFIVISLVSLSHSMQLTPKAMNE